MGAGIEQADQLRQLRSENERLKFALNGTDLGLWDWNIETGEVTFNQRWAEMLGYQLSEIDPHLRSWKKLLHPDDLPQVMQALNDHLEGNTPSYKTEHRLLAKSGEWIWVLDSGKVVDRDSSGRPLRATGTHLEINAQKRQQLLLQARLQLSELSITYSSRGLIAALLDRIETLTSSQLGFCYFVVQGKICADSQLLSQNSFNLLQATAATDAIAMPQALLQDCLQQHVPQRRNDTAELEAATSRLPVPISRLLLVPIVRAEILWAILVVGNKPNDYSQADLDTATALVSMSWDIIQRKQAEEELRRSEQEKLVALECAAKEHQQAAAAQHKYETFFRQANFGLGLADANSGEILECNQALAQLVECTPEELIGRNQAILHGQEPPSGELTDSFIAHRDLTPGDVIEDRFVARSGREIDVEIKGQVFQLADRDLMFAIFQDITERKRTERATRENAAKLKGILRSAPIGIGFVQDRVFKFVNPKFLQLLGFTEAELIGKSSRMVYPNAEEFERVGRVKYKMLQTDEVVAIETVMQKKDGTLVNVSLSSSQVDKEHPEKGTIFTVVDLTDSKAAEEHRQALEAQLRQKYKIEAVGLLAGGMAHNFNNNLAIILGNLELIRLKSFAADQSPQLLENALLAARRAGELVEQIMTYSRNESTTPDLTYLPSVVEETLPMLKSTIPSTVQIKYRQPVAKQILAINASPARIQETLVNLCTNAVHAMEERGELAISVAVANLQKADIPLQYDARPGAFVCMTVEDDGCGMTPDILEHIFDPFFTTKSVGVGTGVGLSTVHGIVKSSGGVIKVDTKPEQGTRFELYFPLQQTETSSFSRDEEELPRGTEKVLFVDDDQMLAQLAYEMLSEAGYQVVVETCPAKALERLQDEANQFDLLVTDQTMPAMTGLELINKVKQLCPGLPALLCTGYSTKISEQNAAKHGIKHFCLKPLSMAQLLQAVRSALAAR